MPPGAAGGAGDSLRLAEILLGLSRVADLGMGLEPGEAARTAVLAARLAEELAAPDPATVYYASLLQHLGCTAYAHEAAGRLGGDEIAVKSASLRTDFSSPRSIVTTYLPNLAPGAGAFVRLRAAGTAMARARSIADGYMRANCEVAAMIARRIGLGEPVAQALGAMFEQPDGRGGPAGLRGDDVPLAVRITHVAAVASLFDGLGGPAAASAVVAERAGAALDADVAAAFCARAPELIGELEAADPLSAARAAEPPPVRTVGGAGIDEVCGEFGAAVDLKSPWFHGHAAGTAGLAEAAARRLGLRDADAVAVRRAALLHDIGRAAIPNGIWEKPGALTAENWERVRLHAYHGERVLDRCGGLARLAPIVGMHHERLDGSGYHRQARGPAIPMPARILAAADALHAMTQARPHRPARSADEAATLLVAERDAGRLDGDAVGAVVAAAGGRAPRPSHPAGLTGRQAEVLRLVAAGLSNPEIAERLVVSRRTAERHVQDVYGKIGVSTRAGAALFAMEHGLVP